MNLIGIDEVGRGAWAGPLVLAAVRINKKFPEGLNDSKKLSKLKREQLSLDLIKVSEWAVVYYSAELIDRFGLSYCLRAGSIRLVSLLFSKNRKIIIDGNINFLAGSRYENSAHNIIRADTLYPEVMAASIIAKVARDSYMTYLHRSQDFKVYSLNSHVGYGTLKHRQSIQDFGISTIHRKSYRPIIKAIDK